MKPILSFLLFTSIVYAQKISGVALDAKTKKPLADALVCDRNKCVKTDAKGRFRLYSKKKTLHIKALGHHPYTFSAAGKNTTHLLRPIRVKALYLTFWGASPKSKTFNNILSIIDKTEINAVVVDIKNEYGNTSYKTDVKRANRYGVWHKRTIKNIDRFMHTLKEHDVYTVARIVTFKDELQAMNNPDYAIKKTNGKIWRNHDNMAWVDPFDRRSWRYVVDIAEDAAKRGFDEINFDYIRFPAKDGLDLKKPNNQKNRIKTIGAFLEYAKKRLQKYGVFVSVDTYGNILWSKDDNNIGQTVDVFAKHADYLCPMLYPSGFSYGSFGFDYPASQPYEVIYRSIKHISDKIDPNRIRPWVQAFRDYRKKRLHYGTFEVQEQIKAADDLRTNGWILWSPSSKYKKEYFLSEEEEHTLKRDNKSSFQDSDRSSCKMLWSD